MNHTTQGQTAPQRNWQNPWCWTLIAVAAAVAACAWAIYTGEQYVPTGFAQPSLALIAVLAAGTALWIRCAARRPSSLNNLSAPAHRRSLFGLAAVHATVAVLVLTWSLAKLNGYSALPGDIGGTLLLGVLTVPWCTYATWQLMTLASRGKQMEERLETAILVTQAGTVALLASWALYWRADFSQWDSLRLFLSVLAAVAFVAGPLIAASTPIRRLAVSALIVLHFAGILTAVISAPPGPWIVGQAQHWIFRPYLSFMYLGNAYRFYSPEPGPACQLWCRIEYQHGKDVVSHWVKLPEIDEQGRHKYPMSLQYTRRLSLTDNVSHIAPAPPATVTNDAGLTVVAPYILRRDQYSPTPLYSSRLGNMPVETPYKVPMHPQTNLNYQQPTLDSQVWLSSYARHLLHQPHPEFPNAKPTAVKIYRVVHQILPAAALATQDADPNDWIYYFPYYMGKFDTDGKLLDPRDPFLYWLLPMMREDPTKPDSPVRGYVFLHAGDADWIRGGR